MLVEIVLNMKSDPESSFPPGNMALNFVIDIKQLYIQSVTFTELEY